jgi:hypothetical protein
LSPDALKSLRSRIHRAELVARNPAAFGFEQKHLLDDGTTHEYVVSGVKSPEQLEDDLLNLFVLVWSLKDHLKESYKAKGLEPRLVEEVVNRSPVLQYVADIANRAKHGVLRESRSGKFAELINVGFTVPHTAIAKITVGSFNVGVDIAKPNEVELRAFVKPKGVDASDAFAILAKAVGIWEEQVIKYIAA